MATAALAPDAGTFDAKKQEAFAQRMFGVLNSAGLAMMVSIGHRTGLFDAMAEMPPTTSAELAGRTGLQERYIREWLSAMVIGDIVEYDPETSTYRLPAEHASHLTRMATPENIATTAQWIAVLAGVEDKIVEAFRRGGGVHYESYGRFHDVMAQESAQTVIAALVDHILPLEPGLNERLRQGIDVLEIGCGIGRPTCLMGACFPASRFNGYDLCEDAVEMAREAACHRGLTNVRFEARDVAALGETDRYDLVMAFDVVHDQASPAEVLRQVHRALKPDGVFLMQDIDTSSYLQNNHGHPLGTFLYTISCMHCMTVSLAQNGAGLGTCWGEELARRMLSEAGFARIEVYRLPHDIINCYYVAKK